MDALKSKLLPIAAALAAAIVFFQPFFASGGDRLSGDLGDNRLLIVIMEHWHAVVAGQAAPLSPNYFAPAQGVLAYSEAMILFVPPYLLFRTATQDSYLAYQLTLITIKILGFLALFALLRRAAGLTPALAAWAAALFALSNMYSVSIGHGQLASAAFLPLILWLAVLAWELLPARPLAAHACAAAAALLLALLFFTAYYIAFFFGLSLGLCAVIFLILELRQPANRFPFRRALPLALSSAVVFAIGLIPFLVTCLPLYRAAGGRPFELVQDQILSVSQIVSPGPANFAWGGIIQSFGSLFQVQVLRESGAGGPPSPSSCSWSPPSPLWRRPKPTPPTVSAPPASPSSCSPSPPPSAASSHGASSITVPAPVASASPPHQPRPQPRRRHRPRRLVPRHSPQSQPPPGLHLPPRSRRSSSGSSSSNSSTGTPSPVLPPGRPCTPRRVHPHPLLP